MIGSANLGSIGPDDHLIPIDEAVTMTARARATLPNSVRAWGFARSALDALLAQSGCAGFRIYRGYSLEGTEQLLIVAIDAAGKDMVAGLVAEEGWPCPPFCDPSSVLNS